MEKVMIETSRSSKTDEAADYLTIKIVLAAFVMLRIILPHVISSVPALAADRVWHPHSQMRSAVLSPGHRFLESWISAV